MAPLSTLRPGESATVHRVGGSGAIRQRLLDLGVLPRAVITLQRIAPVGDPLWITIDDGSHLSLRRTEADVVTVSRKP